MKESAYPNSQNIWSQLISHKRLERDRGSESLKDILGCNENSEDVTAKKMFEIVSLNMEEYLKSDQNDVPWEHKFGLLTGCKCIVSYYRNLKSQPEFAESVKRIAAELIFDGEPRVRLIAAETIGCLSKSCGTSVYLFVKDRILKKIEEDVSRAKRSRSSASTSSVENESEVVMEVDGEGEEGGGEAEAEQVLHDTAGWRALETSMKCLQLIVEGCGSSFHPHIDKEIYGLLQTTLVHRNRFVRETGQYLLAALIECSDSDIASESNPIFISRSQIAEWLHMGLSDNWSQVRLAGSVGTRKMLNILVNYPESKDILPIIIPPMCLNRYYLAEGVRTYSQESWKILSQIVSEGSLLVAQYISSVSQFYVQQSKADNHAVREAACHCIAELGLKVDSSVLQPFVPSLLDTLLICFEDESWPVRDAACVATARFLTAFPACGKPYLEKIVPLFWSQLEDCIPSVRSGAAESLAIISSVYEESLLDTVWPRVQEGLKRIREQPPDSEDLINSSSKFSSLSSQPANFGVARRKRANDPEVHTGQEMYSCGSLAPKMKRGGGCSDHSFRRPSTPWETSDGCLQFLAELSKVYPKFHAQISSEIPVVIKSCGKRDFVHHVQFLETFSKRLPELAKYLGKKYFKPHLQEVFEPIFYSLNCGCELTQVAAEECLRSLAMIFGPSIVRGRIDMLCHPEYVTLYNRIVPPHM